jgi:hypothetical protein
MKAFNISSSKISNNDMANIFNVYQDPVKLDQNSIAYAINRTVFFNNLDFTSKILFDEYVVQPGDEWSLISYKHYGTVELWWIVCKINMISNPTKSPEVDSTLKILKKQYISNIMVSLKNSK